MLEFSNNIIILNLMIEIGKLGQIKKRIIAYINFVQLAFKCLYNCDLKK